MESIKIAKTASSFNKQLNALLDECKGINYKSVVNFCKEINELAGKEVIFCKVSESVKHDYKVHNRLRYNDTYKKGHDIVIKFMNEKYTAHTSDTYQAYNLASFMSRMISNGIDFAVKIKSL